MTKLFKFFFVFHCLTFTAYAADKIWLDPDENPSKINLEIPSLAPLVENLGQAVVNISIEGREKRPGRRLSQDPFGIFKAPEDGGAYFSSLGSGFVIHPDGYIITNNHVIKNATKISVHFKDQKKPYTASVIGQDEKTDIALLKVDHPDKLKAVALGDSESIKQGDWVVAIGNPFRLGHTATAGIVSATSRRVYEAGPYANFIQTDASINPGNSGGPLFNLAGEVVGVNTMIFSPGRAVNIGIGFATPINLVKEILNQLHKRGKVTRGWLGVLIQAVSPDVAEALDLDQAEGALVADVMPNSPAAGAGIERGDVITTFDGQKIEENDELPWIVAQTKVGKKVKVEIIRRGKKQKLDVKIAELTDEVEAESKEGEGEGDETTTLGMSVQQITPELARSLNLEDDSGVIISDVKRGGAAFRAGMRRGDVIVEINAKLVDSISDFRKLIKSNKKNVPMLFLIKRNESTIFLTLKPEEED